MLAILEGELDPLYYYARFLLWKRVAVNARPSHARVDRLLAADALRALRAYPAAGGRQGQRGHAECVSVCAPLQVGVRVSGAMQSV